MPGQKSSSRLLPSRSLLTLALLVLLHFGTLKRGQPRLTTLQMPVLLWLLPSSLAANAWRSNVDFRQRRVYIQLLRLCGTARACDLDIISCFPLILIASDNGIHRKPWDQTLTSAKIIGNPANSSLVQDLMKSLKHRFGAEGGTRTHSMAMSVVHMEKIAAHIAHICPGESPSILCCTLGDKEQRLRCLEYMAFSTTSWTLWLRYVI